MSVSQAHWRMFQLADYPDDVIGLMAEQVAAWSRASTFIGTVVTLNSGVKLRLLAPFNDFHHWVIAPNQYHEPDEKPL